jgi:hypothetical protein
MRSILLLPLAAAAFLTACDSADKPKSPDEVKQEMARIDRPTPGLYRTTSKVVDFQVPGMEPAQAEKMKAMFSTTSEGREYCLTKEEADKGWEEATKKLAEGNCKYERFDASNGKMDAKLSCETGQGMKSTIEMKGTMTSEGSQMTMSVDQSAPGLPGRGNIKMVAEVASERVGDCPGEAK